MTGAHEQQALAIDTNVFLHLFDESANTNSHINSLLGVLSGDHFGLIVDDKGLIAHEYNRHLTPLLSNRNVVGNERSLLRYWILAAQRLVVTIDESDNLMRTIKRIVLRLRAEADRTFVYVALHEGAVLVSNDRNDIVEGPPEEAEKLGERRARLLADTKDLRPDGAAILLSVEAAEHFAT